MAGASAWHPRAATLQNTQRRALWGTPQPLLHQCWQCRQAVRRPRRLTRSTATLEEVETPALDHAGLEGTHHLYHLCSCLSLEPVWCIQPTQNTLALLQDRFSRDSPNQESTGTASTTTSTRLAAR